MHRNARLTAALAGAAIALTPAAALAVTANQQWVNAVRLTTDKCFQLGSNCRGITETRSSVPIYAPPTWPAGTRRYYFTFTAGGHRYYCQTTTRPTSNASGLVTC